MMTGNIVQINRRMDKVDDWGEIKYFSPSEFSCNCGECHGELGIEFQLVEALDHLRELYGKPIKITSGFRCEKHPETKARPTSSHTRSKSDGVFYGGKAADIAISGSRERYLLLEMIFANDMFRRIGIGSDFMHLDLDGSKDEMVGWTY